MSAELEARRTAAAAVLADYQHEAVTADVAERAMWGARLADMLALLLAAPESLSDLGQLVILRQALTDAIAYRDPSGTCPLCDHHPAGLCEDHADDLDKTDAYLALARSLGLEMEQ